MLDDSLPLLNLPLSDHLQGLGRGIEVVSLDWVKRCMLSNRTVDEDGFRLEPANGAPDHKVNGKGKQRESSMYAVRDKILDLALRMLTKVVPVFLSGQHQRRDKGTAPSGLARPMSTRSGKSRVVEAVYAENSSCFPHILQGTIEEAQAKRWPAERVRQWITS